jgi:hypothetical protein
LLDLPHQQGCGAGETTSAPDQRDFAARFRDVGTHCKGSPSSDQTDLLRCLRQHEASLTPGCRRTIAKIPDG